MKIGLAQEHKLRMSLVHNEPEFRLNTSVLRKHYSQVSIQKDSHLDNIFVENKRIAHLSIST